MVRIKRAIISVYDKAGVEEFARELIALGFEIVSSGGTARHMRGRGLTVTDVEELTGFPEMLDGRVKTLHPHVHAGILARRDKPQHLEQLIKMKVAEVDVVAVNLYPFQEVCLRPGAAEEEVIENIDVGGPAMVRSAAKNYQSVAVATSPDHYPLIVDELKKHGEVSPATKRLLAKRAFELCSRYDAAIAEYLREGRAAGARLAPDIPLQLERRLVLRYGENPHQEAGLYAEAGRPLPFEQVHGKEISYNNILDMAAAWELAAEFKRPSCAIVKHTNPCGCASAGGLLRAYQLACQGELPPAPASRFGGIIGLNQPLDQATAAEIIAPGSFYEVIVAPEFEPGVAEMFAGRKGWGQNVRLVRAKADLWREAHRLRSAAGGVLVQTVDDRGADPTKLDFVAGGRPDQAMLDDLLFGFTGVKHVKSNAIVVARGLQAVGIGAGQMNRLASVRLALAQAGDRARGAALASDGFLPFPDNVDEAARAGIKAIIQPGGSVKDAEVFKRAGELGVAMVLTGIRHFRH